MFELLQQPFVQIAILVSLVLAGIHAYLGFHIVSRGVIFVDLSLAQAAAFGYIVSLLIGVDGHSIVSYFVSLGFTFAAAFLISIAREKKEKVPQEAFIGIIYVGFAALGIMLLAQHPEGVELIQEITNGSILTCSMSELLTITALYSLIGVVHFFLRDKFFLISESREKAEAAGINITGWDFVFYALFGLVVTSSVHIAGVLLVFALLVVPPVISLLFTGKKSKRLLFGWIIAVSGALVGIHLSLYGDFPTGPTIIVVLVASLVISLIIKRLFLTK